MSKATFQLKNGTNVEIEGTNEDIKELLDHYVAKSNALDNYPELENQVGEPPPPVVAEIEQDDELVLSLVELAETCEDASSLDQRILDIKGQTERCLVPLYVAYKYIEPNLQLTAQEISDVLRELSADVAPTNVYKVFRTSGKEYIRRDSSSTPVKFKLSRKGVKFVEQLLSTEDE